MQIPHATVRSLAQRPITLEDDEDEDDDGIAAVDAAAAAAVQAAADAEGQDFKQSFAESFAATDTYASSKSFVRSRSRRGVEDGAGSAKARGTTSYGPNQGDDDPSGPTLWTRVSSLFTLGRGRAKVSPSDSIRGGHSRRVIQRSNRAAIWLVSESPHCTCL